MPARGFLPTHGYAMSDIETISTTSGNLMLDIPLAALPPGRGGHSGFQLRLRYNSKIYDGNSVRAQSLSSASDDDVCDCEKSVGGGSTTTQELLGSWIIATTMCPLPVLPLDAH